MAARITAILLIATCIAAGPAAAQAPEGAAAAAVPARAALLAAGAAPRCQWVVDPALPAPFCDVSAAFALSPGSGVKPPAAPTPLWDAILSATAADAACAQLPSEAACAASEYACTWTASAAPSCGLNQEAFARIASGAALCPGTLMARAWPCALAETQEECGRAGKNCSWTAARVRLPPSANGTAVPGGECNHVDWLKALEGKADKVAANQELVSSHSPAVWGSCPTIKALFTLLGKSDACAVATTAAECATHAPQCHWQAGAAGGGGACNPTRALQIAAAGATLTAEYLAAADACGAARSAGDCATSGAAVLFDPAAAAPKYAGMRMFTRSHPKFEAGAADVVIVPVNATVAYAPAAADSSAASGSPAATAAAAAAAAAAAPAAAAQSSAAAPRAVGSAAASVAAAAALAALLL